MRQSLHGDNNDAILDFMKTRKRFLHNSARRERHAILTEMGLKRVKGNLGNVYYE